MSSIVASDLHASDFLDKDQFVKVYLFTVLGIDKINFYDVTYNIIAECCFIKPCSYRSHTWPCYTCRLCSTIIVRST